MKLYGRDYFLALLVAVIILPLTTLQAETKTIHVYVALCDNVNQGIVPVPDFLGNGDDTKNNLYWGAMYGVRTFFSQSKEWKLISKISNPDSVVLERCVFKYSTGDVYVIADAYRGSRIKDAIVDFFRAAAGESSCSLAVNGKMIGISGSSDLVAYVGHDGLMDFSLDTLTLTPNTNPKPAIILACASKSFFNDLLRKCNAYPLLWTTGLMAPEAYTLQAAIEGWIDGKSDAEVRDLAAQAYDRYQKCGFKAANRLLVTGW